MHYFEAGTPENHFYQDCKQRIVNLEGVPSVKIQALTPPVLYYYTNLDFLELLIEISEADLYDQVFKHFDLP